MFGMVKQAPKVEAPEAEITPASKNGTRLRTALWFVGGALLSSAILSGIAFLSVGKWLVKDDPLRQATAIAVLSGNMPARAMEAAELYHDGYAKEIWLTHPGDRVSDGLKDLGLHYPNEEEMNMQVLKRQGVPAKAIHVLDAPVVNTADELNAIGAALKSKGGESVIVVTNKSHTRRVHTIWEKYEAKNGHAIVHAVTDDDFQASRWWENSGDSMQVLREVLGLANAYAGLPVKSSNHEYDPVSADASAPDLMPDSAAPNKPAVKKLPQHQVE